MMFNFLLNNIILQFRYKKGHVANISRNINKLLKYKYYDLNHPDDLLMTKKKAQEKKLFSILFI